MKQLRFATPSKIKGQHPSLSRALVLVTITGWVVTSIGPLALPRPSAGAGRASTPGRVSPPAGAPSEANAAARAREALGKLPLYFVENRGQLDNRVAYYLQGSDRTIYFTPEGLTFALRGPDQKASGEPAAARQGGLRRAAFSREAERAGRGWALKLDFVGARPGVRPEGRDQTEAVFSYFKGPREQWRAGLKTYASIVYPDLWPGIDLVYAGAANRLKYSFVVRPGADPSRIRLAYRGASKVEVNQAGQLEVKTPAGVLSDERPVSYQEEGGRRVEVASGYRLGAEAKTGAQAYGFRLGEYDRSRELVIDPAVFIYAGYIGGIGDDIGLGIAVDSAGNAYVTGSTFSDQGSFPVAVGPDLSFNGVIFDAFVVKIGEPATDADLLLTKTVSPEPVTAGSNLTYTLTLINRGPSPAQSVALTDTLPAEASFVSCAATASGVCGGSGNDRTVFFTSLAPSATASVSFTVKVDCRAPHQAPIVNTATVNSATPDSDPSNNSASAAVTASNPPPTITCPADISALSDPGQTSATLSPSVPVATDAGGCQVTLTGARNDGLKLTEPYPVGVTAITWTATDAAGQAATCTQRVTVRTLADLTVFKSSFSPTRPTAGEIFTYHVEVRNNGPSPALGVALTDRLPGEVVLISAAAGQGACSYSAEPRGLSCQLGAIGPASSAVVLIRVRGLVSGLVVNRVTVEPGAGLTTDPNPSNNTHTQYTRLQ